MTFLVLVSVAPPTVTPAAPPYDSRYLWFESWDGAVTVPIPLDGLHEIIGQRGLLGLGVNPSELATASTPGVPGSRVVDVIQPERPVAIPLAFLADDQVSLWATVQKVRDLTDPTRGMTAEGNFRLVCASSSGTRRLGLAYQSGLEGEDIERYGADQAVLVCTAPMPFAEDRDEKSVEFEVAPTPRPFLTAVPGTTRPWGTIGIVSGQVLSGATPVELTSAVPVWPVLEIDGPGDSVLMTGSNGLRIDIPDGLGSDETLRYVTDPRHRSVRINGELAAGRVARGSRLAPFNLGTTTIEATIPAATATTKLRLTYRPMHRSLW